MAEAALPDSVDSDIEKTINCPICFENMLDSRTLYPCVHTFCAKCVGLLLSKKKKRFGVIGIECPVCRGFVKEREIRTNRLMNVLINLVSREEQGSCDKTGEKITCVQCGASNITSKCLHCNIDLCKNCKDRHCRLPGYQIHRVVSIEETEKEVIKDVIVYCQKHPSELIRANCVPCNTAICSACKLEDHDTHKSESLQSALDRYRDVVRAAVSDIKLNSSNRRKQIAQMKQHQIKLQQKQSHIESQLKICKDNTIKELVNKINKDFTDLKEELKTNTGAMLKAIDLKVDEMEHKLTCDESVATWAHAITVNTDGSGLLVELQLGLLQKIQEIQNDKSSSIDTISKIYNLKHFPLSSVLSRNLIGQLLLEEEEFGDSLELMDPDVASSLGLTNLSLNPTPLTSDSFRSLNMDLCKLQHKNCKKHEQKIDVGFSSLRMCLFQDKIWVPCFGESIIKVFSLKGEQLQTISLRFSNVEEPRALHPLRKNYLVLASETGLYILDQNGDVRSRKQKGQFNDVCVNDRFMVAIDCSSKTIFLWDVKHTSKPKLTFPVTLTKRKVTSTLCLGSHYIYVSDYAGHTIMLYSFEGHGLMQIGQEGTQEPGKLLYPYVCAVDAYGNLVIVDQGNDRIQVWSEINGWSALDLKILHPYDSIIVDSQLFILNGEHIEKNIAKYKL